VPTVELSSHNISDSKQSSFLGTIDLSEISGDGDGLPWKIRMAFVELQRCFARIEKDQEPTLEVSQIWGRRLWGSINWPELREYRRAVLLAEASSGKSEEFRNQVATLRANGRPAFYMTVEELADHGFEAPLEPASAVAFERWRDGSGDGWFFLDSLDEARLNRKSFETALKRFARALGPAIDRARVFISCRVSDWKGSEDRGFIERLLPHGSARKSPSLRATRCSIRFSRKNNGRKRVRGLNPN
jgi:hypothetical protein